MSPRSLSLPLTAALSLLLLVGCPKKTTTTTTVTPTPTVPTEPVLAAAPAEPAAVTTEPSGEDAAAKAAAEAAAEEALAVKDPFDPPDRRQLDDAVAMLTTKDATKAAQALERLEPLQAKYSDQPSVPYNMGVAYMIQGNEDQARRSWLRATEIDPSFDRSWLNLGLLNQRSGRTDLALASFQSGLRYNNRSVDLQVAAINALREQKRYTEAITQAKSALAVNSRAIPLFCNLALVYLETNQLDLAAFLLSKADKDLNGDSSAQLHATLGQVYYRKGFSGDAVIEFQKALAIDPFEMAALQFLGSYYLDNRAYDDATPLWERAAATTPKDAGIHLNLGICYRGLGRFDDAKREYETALQLDARNAEPWRDLAVLYGDYLKSYDAALDAIGQYRAAGGGPPAEIDAWVASIQKTKEKAEKAKKREEDRKRKEAEAAAKAAEQPPVAPEVVTPPAGSAPPPDGSAPPPDGSAPPPTVPPEQPWGQPDPAPTTPPAPQPAPTEPPPQDPASPWGGQ